MRYIYFTFVTCLVMSFLAVSCQSNTIEPAVISTAVPSITNHPPATSQAVIPATPLSFDLDSDPGLTRGKGTPFEVTAGGVTALFSSASDPAAFSIQNNETTFLPLSQFSGNYLFQNGIFPTKLTVKFSQPLTGLKMTFATMDSHSVGEVDIPTSIQLSAYTDSIDTALIGKATAAGSFDTGPIPQGTLSFDSMSKPFNTVVIELVRKPQGTTIFHLDNMVVTHHN